MIWKLNTKRNNGFTLIELLLYTGLLSIFLLVLTQIFTSSLESGLETQATSSVEQDTRFIFSRLAYDLENADSVSTPINEGDTSQSLVITKSSQLFTYSLEDGNILLTNTGSPEQLNSYATSITNLTFQRIGNPSGKPTIRVSFTIQSKTLRQGTAETKTFETTLGTR